MIDLAELPDEWTAALADIASCRSGPDVGIACLPGGERTAEGLIRLGFLERLARRPRFVTLTPWGAEMLGVELFEWEDDGGPVWVLSSRVEEDDRIGRRPFVCEADRGHQRREMNDYAERCRDWFEDGDGEPIKLARAEPDRPPTRRERRAAEREERRVG